VKASTDQFGGLFLLLFCSLYAFLIFDIPLLENSEVFNARSMPIFLVCVGFILSILLLTQRSKETMADFSTLDFWRGARFLLLMSLYGLAIRPMGFLFSTAVFLLCGFWMLGERKWSKNIAIVIPVVIGFWYLMSQMLGVYVAPLPEIFGV